MSDYSELALGQKLDALNLKVVELQKDLAGLSQDVRRILFLLQSEESGDQDGQTPEPGG